ncbi:MAG: hypothetical protein ACLP0L_30040 [Solirubrobacteraceae bacterium]
MLEPTLTDAVASSEVVVVSGPTTSASAGLAEPFRTDPAAGVNTAVSCAVDAANDVEQATVALCPLGVTAVFTQPLIAVAPSLKVTVPQSAVPLLELEVTVAISVTPWFVTAAAGDDSNAVVVGWEAAGVGAFCTGAVVLLLAVVLPPGPVAVTTQVMCR